jgi:hypothetical protein
VPQVLPSNSAGAVVAGPRRRRTRRWIGAAAVATVVTGAVVAWPRPSATVAVVSGRVASLSGSAVGAFGDVEVVSLRDGVIAAAGPVTAGGYSVKVAPGRYLAISRSERLPGARSLVSAAPVTAATNGSAINLAAGLPFGPSPAGAAVTGDVVAIGPISLTAPDGWGYSPKAVANGAIISGFTDPCQKAGKRVTDIDPNTIQKLKGEHRLADEGRSTPLPTLDIPQPSEIITGNVTVDQNGRPTADLTISDPSGNVIDHVVVPGEPGQFPQSGVGDDGAFLRLVGKGLAGRECNKEKPVTIAPPRTTSPKPTQPNPPSTATNPPGPVTRVVTIRYTGTGSSLKVQHVDNRPGHGGSNFDDTYKKDASWDITWDITITDGQVTAVSDPKGTVTGTTSAQILSQPAGSCSGPVGLEPDAAGALKVPMTVSVVGTTPTAINMELGTSVPLGWGFSTCVAAAAAVQLPVADYAAYTTWAQDTLPRFSLSLPSYQLQADPVTLNKTWPFPPVSADYKAESQHWTSQITVTGIK